MWGGIKELGDGGAAGPDRGAAPPRSRTSCRGQGLLPWRVPPRHWSACSALAPAPGCSAYWAAAAILVAKRGLGGLWASGWRFAVWLVPLIVIGLIGHPLLPESTKFLLSASTDLGNLAGPISPAHLLGIWPAHDFREEAAIAVSRRRPDGGGRYGRTTGAWSALRERDPACSWRSAARRSVAPDRALRLGLGRGQVLRDRLALRAALRLRRPRLSRPSRAARRGIPARCCLRLG